MLESQAGTVVKRVDANPIADSQSKSTQSPALKNYRIKLADFGLARRAPDQQLNDTDESESLTESAFGSFAGTPAYASPEQMLQGKPATHLSDIWAVGATLYHMLCGVPPYSGRPHAIARQMRQGPPTPPRQVDPRIPRDLESICMKALSISPSLRYSTAQQLVDDLNRFLTGLPVVARPIRWPGKLLRLIARHPLASGLIASLFISLVAGVIVSNHFRMRAEDNLADAVTSAKIASKERDNAVTVINLLKSMISASDAYYGRPDIKLVDALKGLEERIDAQLRDKPEIEAEVRSSLAAMYFSVADYESAYRQNLKAVELRGEDCVEPAQIRNQLEFANNLRWLNRSDEALEKADRYLKLSNRVLGADHEISLYGVEVLAGCYRDLGRPRDAYDLLERAIDIGGESERSLTARSGLASILLDLGKAAEAESQLRTLIGLRKELGLTDSRESVLLDTNLAVAIVEQGRIEESIELQRATAERATKLLGRSHDLSLGAWLNLADALRRHGQIDEAMEINQRLWDTCKEELGAAHPQTLDFAESVILNHIRMKKYREALQLTEDTLSQVSGEITPETDWYHRLVGLRCSALSTLGRASEAVPIYEKVVDYFVTRRGSQSALALAYKSNFGLALIEAGEFDRAEKLYRDMLLEMQEKSTDRHSVERSIKRNLGLVLVRSGQSQSARELLEAVERESRAAGELENAQKCKEYLAELEARK